MKVISLDIETTGLDKINHSILQVGAVFVDTDNYMNDECIKFNIKHTEVTGSLFALNMNADLINEILHSNYKGENEYTIATIINNFAEHFIGSSRYTIIGKNAGVFDIPFINNKSSEELACHRRVMDVGTLYTDNDDTVVPNLSECFEKLGIEHVVEHDALTDAVDVAYLLHRKFNNSFNVSLNGYRTIVKNKNHWYEQVKNL